MEEKDIVRAEVVIEPEILDENGNPIRDESRADSARPHARPKSDMGGLVGGFFVLAFGFIMTLLVAVFTICVVLPLMLLGKLLGFQVRTFKR